MSGLKGVDRLGRPIRVPESVQAKVSTAHIAALYAKLPAGRFYAVDGAYHQRYRETGREKFTLEQSLKMVADGAPFTLFRKPEAGWKGKPVAVLSYDPKTANGRPTDVAVRKFEGAVQSIVDHETAPPAATPKSKAWGK